MNTEPNPNPEANIVALPPPGEPPAPALLWMKRLDPFENTTLHALSHAIGDADGNPCFEWRVTPMLRKDRIVYEVRQTDAELLPDGAAKLTFDDAGAAQAWCERVERDMGGALPTMEAPQPEETPLVADAKGYCPTNKVVARWSRNSGALYLYRVWAKPDDLDDTQERELEGDDYEAALVQFVRQKLLEDLAEKVVSGWVSVLSVPGHWGRFEFEVEVDFVRVRAFKWHRPQVIRGNAKKRFKEISMTVELPTPTHESVIRAAALMERKHRLELDAKASEKTEEQLRAEIAANAAAAGIAGNVLPVTLEDMQAVGVDPTKPLK